MKLLFKLKFRTRQRRVEKKKMKTKEMGSAFGIYNNMACSTCWKYLVVFSSFCFVCANKIVSTNEKCIYHIHVPGVFSPSFVIVLPLSFFFFRIPTWKLFNIHRIYTNEMAKENERVIWTETKVYKTNDATKRKPFFIFIKNNTYLFIKTKTSNRFLHFQIHMKKGFIAKVWLRFKLMPKVKFCLYSAHALNELRTTTITTIEKKNNIAHCSLPMSHMWNVKWAVTQ